MKNILFVALWLLWNALAPLLAFTLDGQAMPVVCGGSVSLAPNSCLQLRWTISRQNRTRFVNFGRVCRKCAIRFEPVCANTDFFDPPLSVVSDRCPKAWPKTVPQFQVAGSTFPNRQGFLVQRSKVISV